MVDCLTANIYKNEKDISYIHSSYVLEYIIQRTTENAKRAF